MQSTASLTGRIETRIRSLSESTIGPFYLYDTGGIRKVCRQFQSIRYTPKSIHFAIMSNASPQFLRIIQEEGLAVFVASAKHLELAVELGYEGTEIVFAASALDEDTMQLVHARQATVILDSTGQLEQWRRLFPISPVGIRCNIGDLVSPKETRAGYFIGAASRLGLTLDEIEEIQGDDMIEGLHVYVGTDILDLDYFLACYEVVAHLARQLPSIRYIDFGGGFGIPDASNDQFPIECYGKRTSDLMYRLSGELGRSIKLILEPGRVIAGMAGYFVCRVTDVKMRGEHQLVGVNASSVQFPRPLFYPSNAYHPVYLFQRTYDTNHEMQLRSSVYGCSTYSRDYLARDIMLPRVSLDDLVVFGHAGAYCATAHTDFLGFERPTEYFR